MPYDVGQATTGSDALIAVVVFEGVLDVEVVAATVVDVEVAEPTARCAPPCCPAAWCGVFFPLAT